ncbi:UPF0175 family protein [Hymenobacter coccineus]|uniref:Uncharacterized protein n=1 Tax=Hymenobacter coccineus TaxID=1908235 RepID=A0A1G1SYD2_9BACT|nr:UPF0175 family protein [Hymenobacter coccineus]OGX83645.1 hypothetical protein BEN49_12280 [Hymenobacter coccineus]
MQTLTLYLPDSLDLDAKEATMLLATRLYEQGKVTLGQAAEMAGYSKRTFMELLGNYGVSVFNLTEEELLNDVQNAARYHC